MGVWYGIIVFIVLLLAAGAFAGKAKPRAIVEEDVDDDLPVINSPNKIYKAEEAFKLAHAYCDTVRDDMVQSAVTQMTNGAKLRGQVELNDAWLPANLFSCAGGQRNPLEEIVTKLCSDEIRYHVECDTTQLQEKELEGKDGNRVPALAFSVKVRSREAKDKAPCKCTSPPPGTVEKAVAGIIAAKKAGTAGEAR